MESDSMQLLPSEDRLLLNPNTEHERHIKFHCLSFITFSNEVRELDVVLVQQYLFGNVLR